MRLKILLLILFSFIYTFSYSQRSSIELPINSKFGFGPFVPNMIGLQPYSKTDNNPWEKTYLNVSGIPKNWKNVKIGDIETNKYQSVYQDYISGMITTQWYELLQKNWPWKPDTLRLSKKPIKSKIAFAYGVDENGETRMIIDSNNNLDFSDDNIITPIAYDILANPAADTDVLVKKYTVLVTYEKLFENKIIRDSVPLLVSFYKEMNMFLYNFPIHFTTNLQGTKIDICSDEFCSPSFNKSTKLALLNDSIEKKSTSNNEYISIGNSLYLNKGVNPIKNVLILEKVETDQSRIESTKVGFKLISFKGVDFETKRMINSDSYLGKYLLIDFWGTWCNPCIHELPILKEIYGNIDKSKFEIIGIVVGSPVETLKVTMDKFLITWPQVISDSNNQISNSYGVQSYPTTYLIDPNGIIIAKNLRGIELKNKINELINQ